MNYIFGPDAFGCSSKVDVSETHQLRAVLEGLGASAGATDFSALPQHPHIVTSVDRVSRCTEDWANFARIAFAHCENDLIAARAFAQKACVCFEFGQDAADAASRAAIVAAFGLVGLERGVLFGKCHSTQMRGPSAVVVTVIGVRKEAPEGLSQGAGAVLLSRPVGAFKLHYLSELGVLTADPKTMSILTQDVRQPLLSCSHLWLDATDVSGHGLGAALADLAQRNGVTLRISLSKEEAQAPEVLSIPVQCFDAAPPSLAEFGSVEARSLSVVSETAGPLVLLVPEASAEDCLSILGKSSALRPRKIGEYTFGQPSLDISWK